MLRNKHKAGKCLDTNCRNGGAYKLRHSASRNLILRCFMCGLMWTLKGKIINTVEDMK